MKGSGEILSAFFMIIIAVIFIILLLFGEKASASNTVSVLFIVLFFIAFSCALFYFGGCKAKVGIVAAIDDFKNGTVVEIFGMLPDPLASELYSQKIFVGIINSKRISLIVKNDEINIVFASIPLPVLAVIEEEKLRIIKKPPQG